jgi:hypothetical protein
MPRPEVTKVHAHASESWQREQRYEQTLNVIRHWQAIKHAKQARGPTAPHIATRISPG